VSKTPKLFALLLLTLTLSLNSYAQALDCGPSVSLANGIITIAPEGGSDTPKIQCALDAAGALGVTTVRLAAGSFGISQIIVEGFEGTFQGQSIASTLLFIFSDSIDCDAELDAGRTPAGIKFINGNVKVARMTIETDAPCIESTSRATRFALIHFTGSDALSGCESETGFGQVDRVEMRTYRAQTELPATTAVAAFAEGKFLGTCRDTQLGTFKLNRSELINFVRGVDVSLRGAGQVDINFSRFQNIRQAVVAENANQLMTVQSNEFNVNTFPDDSLFLGVVVANESGPVQNRVVVYNNEFSWSGINVTGTGVLLESTAEINLSAAITGNTFRAIGDGAMTWVELSNINGGSISGNTFEGSSFSGIDVGGSTNVISGNDFSALMPTVGDSIFLNGSSSNNIVGPLQSALILDIGVGNFEVGFQFPHSE
jgi:hypothetical protein